MVYPGAYYVGNSPNQNPRQRAVNQVILHHCANPGNVNDVLDMFMRPNSRSVSANFLVAQDGRVFEVVNPDTGRAWTSGSGPNGSISPDHSAITFEVMNETGAPHWTISAAACEAVAQVMAWAAKRYGMVLTRGVNVRGHRELPGQSTACPGGMPMDDITNRANEILAGPKTPTEEEELASVLAQVEELIAASQKKIINAIQRENRPRLYRNSTTGEISAIDEDQGYYRVFANTAELDLAWRFQEVAPETALELSDKDFKAKVTRAKARLAELTK